MDESVTARTKLWTSVVTAYGGSVTTRWVAVPWRRIGIAVYIGLNVGLLLYMHERPGPQNVDWRLWEALRGGPMYSAESGGIPFVYSPLAGYALIGVTYLGYWAWFAAHVAVLWLLRFSPLLVLLVAVSWGWWSDAMMGNAFVFVFVAGVLAFRGSKGWALAFMALSCLMPRPVQVPLALWLLWTMPAIRWATVGIVAANVVLIALSGLGPAWIAALRNLSASDIAIDLGPTVFFGAWWFIVGLPLAAWLTWKRRPGWAGLALTPYTLPQYLLMPFIDHARSDRS